MENPFNCKALTGSGQLWQGHWFLLTFLTELPRKLLLMYTWKQGADMWGGKTGMTQKCPLFGHVSVAVNTMVITGWARVPGQPRISMDLKNTELMLITHKLGQLWPNMDNDFALFWPLLSELLPQWVSPSARQREVNSPETVVGALSGSFWERESYGEREIFCP